MHYTALFFKSNFLCYFNSFTIIISIKIWGIIGNTLCMAETHWIIKSWIYINQKVSYKITRGVSITMLTLCYKFYAKISKTEVISQMENVWFSRFWFKRFVKLHWDSWDIGQKRIALLRPLLSCNVLTYYFVSRSAHIIALLSPSIWMGYKAKSYFSFLSFCIGNKSNSPLSLFISFKYSLLIMKSWLLNLSCG